MDDGDAEPQLKRLRPSGEALDELAPDEAGGEGAAAAAAEVVSLALRRAAQRNMDSVLKLYVMQAEPNYAQPWQARLRSGGSGVATALPQPPWALFLLLSFA